MSSVTALRTTVATHMRAEASWRVLASGRFRAYFLASSVSNFGTWLQNTAQMLLAYKLTHSAFGVGIVICMQFIGFLTIGLWAGAIAERIGRRRVLIWTQLLSALVAASLGLVLLYGRLTERELVAGALAMGLALTFALPVQTTLVADLVPERERKAALAMNSVSYNAGRAIAPLVCLAIVFTIGTGWAFLLNGLTFFGFAITLSLVCRPSSTVAPRRPKARTGLRVALARPRILLMLAMVAAVTVADDPIAVLGPSLAHKLGMASIWPAYFLSALGIGTLVGATLPMRKNTAAKHVRRRDVAPAEARLAAVGLAVLAVSVVVFAAGIHPWLSIAAAVVAGVAGLVTGAAAQALLLETVGPRFAVSVMGLWAVAWAGPKPIASFLDGLLAGHIGLTRTAAILAAPAIVLASLELGMPEQTKRRLKAFMDRKFKPSSHLNRQTLLPLQATSATSPHRAASGRPPSASEKLPATIRAGHAGTSRDQMRNPAGRALALAVAITDSYLQGRDSYAARLIGRRANELRSSRGEGEQVLAKRHTRPSLQYRYEHYDPTPR